MLNVIYTATFKNSCDNVWKATCRKDFRAWSHIERSGLWKRLSAFM